MAVTIKDIASLAGVSKTTVSKVINNKDNSISKETRDKILKIIEENQYRPNKIAKGLATKKTYTLAIIIPDIRNTFFTDIYRGVEDYSRKKGYSIILSSTYDNQQIEYECLNMLAEKMIDGIVLIPSSYTLMNKKVYKSLNTPIVLVDKNIPYINAKSLIKVDNKKGIFNSVKHLVDNGHKSILYISGPLKNSISEERLIGYKEALKYHNLEFSYENVVEGEYKSEWAYNFIKSKDDINYTAICCANDLIAIGVIQALKDKNINVPNDISIVGFDDIEISKLIYPSLTTIRQPAYDMGVKAAEVLIDVIDNKYDKDFKTIVFEPNLVTRESTSSITQK